MTTLRKLLLMTLSLFIIIVLFSYIRWLLGFDGLVLIGMVQLPRVIVYLLEFVFYAINFILIIGIVANIYTLKIFKYVLPYLLIDFIIQIFYSSFITSTILPIGYIIIVAIYRKDLKASLKRLLKLLILVLPYQVIMLFIKTKAFNFGYNNLTIYQCLMFSIDLILYLAILYCIGGERNYELAIRNSINKLTQCKFILFSEEIESPRLDNEDLIALERFQGLTGWKKLKSIIILVAFQIFQWIIILFICKMGDVLLEGITITVSFVAYGMIIQKRWHSNSILVCTLMSSLLFYISARAVIPFELTQFSPVLIGMFLVYALYRIAIYTER